MYRNRLQFDQQSFYHSFQRAEQAEQKADEAAMLQDEVDYLREKADQATRLQAAVDSFKKKAEEINSVKMKVNYVSVY